MNMGVVAKKWSKPRAALVIIFAVALSIAPTQVWGCSIFNDGSFVLVSNIDNKIDSGSICYISRNIRKCTKSTKIERNSLSANLPVKKIGLLWFSEAPNNSFGNRFAPLCINYTPLKDRATLIDPWLSLILTFLSGYLASSLQSYLSTRRREREIIHAWWSNLKLQLHNYETGVIDRIEHQPIPFVTIESPEKMEDFIKKLYDYLKGVGDLKSASICQRKTIISFIKEEILDVT